MLTLRQLEILRAMVRFQTTMATARHLSLSQPAVSTAIRQIETQLGFPLFERVNNRLHPLEAASIVQEEAEPLLALHAALTERLQDLREAKTSRLRILSTPPLGQGVVPRVLGGFARRHPKLKIHFDIRDLNDVVRAVESGAADLGIGIGLGPQATLEVEVLAEARMVAICPPGHALAGLAVVTPGDLGAHSLVALDADTRMGAAVRHAFQSARQPFLFRAEVRTCSTACALVGTGTGVSVVDPFSAAYPPAGTLEIRPFEPAIPATAWAFWSNRKPLSQMGRRLIGEMRLALVPEPVPKP
ncbi:LysR substrate-binding domain-containing protein [Roseomonas gilardii]|uniref:LysR substrate-binding domain-containing protein n=1 Tax=Roseomonas gilardii TaxID=257708 RepID=UPI0011A068B0|nr:LysR substrate-binding domain-containing protein [Roseomonas gilardii]